MKKKVAILTQPLGLNYGGIMQNYALQKVLKKMGFEPLTVDRQLNKKSAWIQFKIKVYNLLYRTTNREISFKIKEIAAKHNTDFIDGNIIIGSPIRTDNDFYSFFKKNNFDVYIVGSDQTWRPKYSPNIYNYYLDFLDKKNDGIKKIAYASSFGTDKWEYSTIATEKVKKLVKRFDSISVREDSGLRLCEDYLDVKVKLVLDPTLLLSAEDYVENLNLKNGVEEKFMFTYVLDESGEKLNYIKACALKLALEVTSSQSKKNIFDYKESDTIEDYIQPPIEYWLSGFKNADFVITDSFHGMVFSILFRKPFLAIINKERGASRFTSLLTQLNLLDRLVYNTDSIPTELLNSPIDYDGVHEKLQHLKDKSLEFLKQNLC